MGRCQGVFELRSALVLAIAVAISGCASHGETYEAPLSAADCVVGWNSGMVAWEPVGGGGLRPTRESGLVARDLSVVAGSECRIAFRLPGNRLLVVASSGVRDASEAQQGLDWRLSQGTTNAFGVMNPLEAGLHNVTSGCQADTGEIMLSGCPAHDPAVSRFPSIKCNWSFRGGRSKPLASRWERSGSALSGAVSSLDQSATRAVRRRSATQCKQTGSSGSSMSLRRRRVSQLRSATLLFVGPAAARCICSPLGCLSSGFRSSASTSVEADTPPCQRRSPRP